MGLTPKGPATPNQGVLQLCILHRMSDGFMYVVSSTEETCGHNKGKKPHNVLWEIQIRKCECICSFQDQDARNHSRWGPSHMYHTAR